MTALPRNPGKDVLDPFTLGSWRTVKQKIMADADQARPDESFYVQETKTRTIIGQVLWYLTSSTGP